MWEGLGFARGRVFPLGGLVVERVGFAWRGGVGRLGYMAMTRFAFVSVSVSVSGEIMDEFAPSAKRTGYHFVRRAGVEKMGLRRALHIHATRRAEERSVGLHSPPPYTEK
ncbi:predicted protein [Plenodomus lingam JN3]|uniref:Predicted protein n=1 Tax=Leptosphaeria maculans (strain JN3 / isolate v23.1.3 / race Av1-4-5-6-7-8) TaxID=985895 RepID=E5A0J9_LEPMJ|nr:predicted protein [Plenodomus lingam JN3]CBX97059.1 predicted protein [Plenodomus lingam JN3]